MSRQPKHEQFLLDLKADLEGRAAFSTDRMKLHNDRAALAMSRNDANLADLDYRSAAEESGRAYAYQTVINKIAEALSTPQGEGDSE